MKTTLKIAAFLVASVSLSSGASIIVGNLVDVNFISPLTATPASTPLGNTFTAKIGFLTTGTVLTTQSTFATINAAWTNAGNITFASGDAAGSPGYFGGTATFTDAASLAGKDVYVWVTNGAGLNFVLHSTSTDFLADASIPNSNTADISAQTLGNGTWVIDLGTRTLTGANAANGGSLVLNNAVVVPEPSSMMLGAVAALGLLRRRR